MANVLGMNCELYRGTAGTTADTLMNNVTDVSVSMEQEEADVTTRGNNGYRATVGTLKNGTIEWSMIWDTSDADFAAIYAAYNTGAPIALFASDGDGSGLDADFAITNFSQEQSLTEAVTVSITAKATYSTRAPEFVIAS